MYIGTIPTPASTESRQEFTCTAGQTTFNTTGGTTGYIDCFLNGVKLDSRSDFSFDGSVVTLTTAAAANDILAVIMRQADNALVALPIKDSGGNNVLSEANNVVTLSNDVAHPTISGMSSGTYASQTQIAGGKALQIQQASHSQTVQIIEQDTGYNLINCVITPTQANSKILVMLNIWVGAFNPNGALRLKRTVNNVSNFLGEASNPYSSDAGFFSSDDYNSYTNYTFTDFSWTYLDSHGSSTSYAIDYRLEPNSITNLYLNRPAYDTSSGNATSTMTLIEFA